MTQVEKLSDIRLGLNAFLMKSIIVVCLLSLTGGSWMGLQVFAWTKMVWERSLHMGLSEAIVDVASREHPCDVCLFIQEERSKEENRQEPSSLQNNKREPMAVSQLVSIPPSILLGAVRYFAVNESQSRRTEPPPKAPPRSVG